MHADAGHMHALSHILHAQSHILHSSTDLTSSKFQTDLKLPGWLRGVGVGVGGQELESEEYYWRLDADSFLLAPVGFDVFEKMAREDKVRRGHAHIRAGVWGWGLGFGG
eukprot:1008381-Rhodomonas_salina.1